MLWVAMIVTGVMTYAFRVSVVVAVERFPMPPLLQRALGFVPAAVLSALIVPELVLRGGMLDIAPTNPRLVAGLVAALVAWRTRNVLLTLMVGMVVVLVWPMLVAWWG
jgi:branched-subunit amino acid transport protein